jgi:protease-4
MSADALKNKLVDHLGYFDEVVDQLNAIAGHDDTLESFRQITLAKYAEKINPPGDKLAQKIVKEGDRIALVYAEGEIVDGEGNAGQVGGDSLARELRDLRTDKDVKAIVLRVNSPGGSAVASEVIQREIRLLHTAKKPVIVSFGSLAASGGYWISVYGDYIFAEPTTITGSIGVFGLKFNLDKIAGDHGVTFDTVKTTQFGNMDSISQPWSDDEVKLAQTVVDYLYDQFLDKVAEGRKLTVAQVGEIAQGRVWSGTDAIDNHLVDAIGGLQDALNMAEDKAGLKGKKWTLQQIPEKLTPVDALLQAFGGGDAEPVARAAQNSVTQTLTSGHDPVSTALQKVDANWQLLRGFNDPHGVYARLPYLMDF